MEYVAILIIRRLFSVRFSFIIAITFCIVGSACSNKQLLSSLENRYIYECVHDEQQVINTLSDSKTLLSQHQLRIYVVDSFDDTYLFQYLKETEDIYTISSELVSSCIQKEIVNIKNFIFELAKYRSV